MNLTSVIVQSLRGIIQVFFPWLYQPPVLIYHGINTDARGRDVLARDLFAGQMEFIKKAGLEVAPLDELIAGADIRNKIFLTFDDGVGNFYSCAWPVIKSYRYPVTLFVITDRIGRPGYLSCAELRQLAESGLVTVGSHTAHHRYLPDLTPEEIEEETSGSKRIIEETVNRRVDFLAYPWGGFNELTKEVVKRAGYRAAFTTNQGFKMTQGLIDPYAIKRLSVTSKKAVLRFMVKTSGLGTCFSRTLRK